MNNNFHLYPGDETEQRLRLSTGYGGLKDLHHEPGFTQAIAQFNVEISEITDNETGGSWQELRVKPPIPAEKIRLFSSALLKFASDSGRHPSGTIGFIDHTDGGYTVHWPDRSEKPNKKRAVGF